MLDDAQCHTHAINMTATACMRGWIAGAPIVRKHLYRVASTVGATTLRVMTNSFIVVATVLALVGVSSHSPGAPIGGSTGIGSGLGHQGTGPGYLNGTNSPPQPPTYSVPPGGYRYAPPTVAPPAGLSSPSFGPP